MHSVTQTTSTYEEDYDLTITFGYKNGRYYESKNGRKYYCDYTVDPVGEIEEQELVLIPIKYKRIKKLGEAFKQLFKQKQKQHLRRVYLRG